MIRSMKLAIVALVVLAAGPLAAQQRTVRVEGDITVRKAPGVNWEHAPRAVDLSPGLSALGDAVAERQARRQRDEALEIQRQRLALERERLDMEKARGEARAPIPVVAAQPQPRPADMPPSWQTIAVSDANGKTAMVMVDKASVRRAADVSVLRWALVIPGGKREPQTALVVCGAKTVELAWPQDPGAIVRDPGYDTQAGALLRFSCK